MLLATTGGLTAFATGAGATKGLAEAVRAPAPPVPGLYLQLSLCGCYNTSLILSAPFMLADSQTVQLIAIQESKNYNKTSVINLQH